MTLAGLKEVEAAKADGRWATAYESFGERMAGKLCDTWWASWMTPARALGGSLGRALQCSVQKTVTIGQDQLSSIFVSGDSSCVLGRLLMSVKTKPRSNAQECRAPIKPGSSPGKAAWKKVIDLALYIVACALTGTGLLLAYRLPHGGGHTGRVLF
jgi:hypothetical protein